MLYVIIGLAIVILLQAGAGGKKQQDFNKAEENLVRSKKEADLANEEIEHLKTIIEAMRVRCSEKDEEIRLLKEGIENRKDILMNQSEKELLVNIMLALDTYAARIDKMDLNAQLEELGAEVKTIRESVEEYDSDRFSERFDSLENGIGYINDTVEYIQNNMLESVYVPDELDSALQDIQSKVDGIESSVENLPEPDSYYLCQINTALERMSSSISEIQNGMQSSYEDDSSDYSISDELESIKADVQTLLYFVHEKLD